MTATVTAARAVVSADEGGAAPRQHLRAWSLWLVALVAAGAAFRLAGLGASRLNYDESFTAMAGRLPISGLGPFLARNDSHPPLDYLLHLPLARAGVSEFWFRLPSVVCSIGALAVFAWWVRRWGRVGVIATGLMAISAFQITHGREARMYAELELIGVAVAMLALAWLRRPSRRIAAMLGVVVFLGLLAHVSMFLVAAGLLTLASRRTDRDAWWWRGALAAAGVGWATVWGSTFLVQAGGGHSAWIPRTSPATLVTAVGRLVTFAPSMSVIVVGATILGGTILRRRDHDFGRVWIACFAVPVCLAALAGLAEPVVLDRTFTLMSWAPLLAVALALDALLRRSVAIGAVAIAAVVLMMVPAAFGAMEQMTGPNAPLRALEQRVHPGDIVAVRPLSKAPELQWSLGVRHQSSVRRVAVPGNPHAFGLQFGNDDPSGRLLLLDWRHRSIQGSSGHTSCGRGWSWGHTHISCTSVKKGLDRDINHGD